MFFTFELDELNVKKLPSSSSDSNVRNMKNNSRLFPSIVLENEKRRETISFLFPLTGSQPWSQRFAMNAFSSISCDLAILSFLSPEMLEKTIMEDIFRSFDRKKHERHFVSSITTFEPLDYGESRLRSSQKHRIPFSPLILRFLKSLWKYGNTYETLSHYAVELDESRCFSLTTAVHTKHSASALLPKARS